MRTAVEIVSLSFLVSMPFSLTWAARLTEPKLHTAVSSLEVFNKISVHKLELWTTPAWSWGERTLEGSFQVIQGWPVSKTIPSILRHNCTAEIVLKLLIFPSLANCSY